MLLNWLLDSWFPISFLANGGTHSVCAYVSLNGLLRTCVTGVWRPAAHASGGPWGRWGCLYVGRGELEWALGVESAGSAVDAVLLQPQGAPFTRIWFRAAQGLFFVV